MAWKHRKLLMNLGNAVDALCAPDEAADELEELARAEGEAVLVAAGVPLISAEEDVARRGDILQPRPSGQPPRGGSTWQSLSRGTGSVEVDYLPARSCCSAASTTYRPRSTRCSSAPPTSCSAPAAPRAASRRRPARLGCPK